MEMLPESYRRGIFSLRPWMQLVKAPLCLPVACTAIFGYSLQGTASSLFLPTLFFGVFFLSCGAAGCNSIQERSTDRLFLRTCQRPLVTGSLRAGEAFFFCAILLVAGLLLLGLADSWVPLLLGITALVLYNCLYTPFKKISVLALIPGGLAGALPPLIGWTAGGGELDDSRALHLLVMFFLWQIPHFTMVLLHHREDYLTVDRPSLLRLLSERSLRNIAAVWILAFNVTALSLTLHPDLLQPGSRLTIALMTLTTTTLCIPLLRAKTPGHRFLFLVLNGSFFTALLLVSVLQFSVDR